MADHVVEATLKVNVTGDEAAKKKLHDIAAEAKQTQAYTYKLGERTATGGRKLVKVPAVQTAMAANANVAAATASSFSSALKKSFQNVRQNIGATAGAAARSLSSNVLQPFKGGLAKGLGIGGRGVLGGIGGLIRSELSSLGSVGMGGLKALGSGLKSLGGAMWRTAGITGALTTAIGALGAGFGAWKLFSESFSAAVDTAKETMMLAGKARQFKTDMDTVENSMETATELMGTGAEAMAKKLEGTLEKLRMGKALSKGDKEVAGRLGMTQKKVLDFEKNLGRRGMLTDYALNWAENIERDQKAIDEAKKLGKKGEGKVKKLEANMRQRLIDLAKVFGDDFAELVATKFAPQYIREMKQAQEEANNILGPQFGKGFAFETSDDYLRSAQRMLVNIAGIKRAFGEMKNAIGVEVTPSVERLTKSFFNLLKSIGPSFTAAIKDIASGGFDWATANMDEANTGQMSEVIRNVGKSIGDFLRGMPKITDLDFMGIWDKIVGAGESAVSTLEGVVTALDTIAGMTEWLNIAKTWARAKEELSMVPGSDEWKRKHEQWQREDEAAPRERAARAEQIRRNQEERRKAQEDREYEAKWRAVREKQFLQPGQAAPGTGPLSDRLPTTMPKAEITAPGATVSLPSMVPGSAPSGVRQLPPEAGGPPAGTIRLRPPWWGSSPEPREMPDLAGSTASAAETIKAAFDTGQSAITTGAAAIVTNAQTAQGIINAVDLTTSASAAGTALGTSAAAAIRAGLAGIQIPAPAWLGQARALASAGSSNVGRDAPTAAAA